MPREQMRPKKHEHGGSPPSVKVARDGPKQTAPLVALHVMVPPDEKEEFLEWMRKCRFADLKGTLRWVMWYCRSNLEPEEVRKMIGA